MRRFVNSLWHDFLRPLFVRPDFVQVAAFCWRMNQGQREILLITSSNNNWIIPKGWPINGLDGAEAALTEAWEEAGVTADRSEITFLGKYHGQKEMWEGVLVDARTHVYAIPVTTLSDDYPEVDERDRQWARLSDAADMVNDQNLAAFLRSQIN